MSELDPKDATRLAIEILGGPVSAARVIAVKGGRYQTVQSWLSNRVPAEYCPVIERETGLRGRTVRCEDLRPDIAWRVLRAAPQSDPSLATIAPAEQEAARAP